MNRSLGNLVILTVIILLCAATAYWFYDYYKASKDAHIIKNRTFSNAYLGSDEILLIREATPKNYPVDRIWFRIGIKQKDGHYDRRWIEVLISDITVSARSDTEPFPTARLGEQVCRIARRLGDMEIYYSEDDDSWIPSKEELDVVILPMYVYKTIELIVPGEDLLSWQRRLEFWKGLK